MLVISPTLAILVIFSVLPLFLDTLSPNLYFPVNAFLNFLATSFLFVFVRPTRLFLFLSVILIVFLAVTILGFNVPISPALSTASAVFLFQSCLTTRPCSKAPQLPWPQLPFYIYFATALLCVSSFILRGSLPSSYIGLSSISFLILSLYIYSIRPNTHKSYLIKALCSVFLLYILVLAQPTARGTLKLIFPVSFTLILLYLPRHLRLASITSPMLELVKLLKTSFTRLANSLRSFLALAVCSTIIIGSISFLFLVPSSRELSSLTRKLVFQHILVESLSDPGAFLFGHGLGSTTLRFDVSSMPSQSLIKEDLQTLSSVSSHSMPLEAAYELGWPYTFILSLLFIRATLSLKSCRADQIVFLSSFLSANLLLPSLSISAEPLHQLFLPTLCLMICFRDVIRNY